MTDRTLTPRVVPIALTPFEWRLLRIPLAQRLEELERIRAELRHLERRRAELVMLATTPSWGRA